MNNSQVCSRNLCACLSEWIRYFVNLSRWAASGLAVSCNGEKTALEFGELEGYSIEIILLMQFVRYFVEFFSKLFFKQKGLSGWYLYTSQLARVRSIGKWWCYHGFWQVHIWGDALEIPIIDNGIPRKHSIRSCLKSIDKLSSCTMFHMHDACVLACFDFCLKTYVERRLLLLNQIGWYVWVIFFFRFFVA